MKKLSALFLLLCTVLPLAAQNRREEPADSLVRLMSAQSAELIQEQGRNYRKVVGPARFLHNKTYLICDTAYWDVDVHIIKAFGHVRILQDETVLSSEKLDYYIDDDLAQFRGTVVQLQDKDKNTLRTRFLDYNTKDSVAVFKHGGAMRDKDGQLIESRNGSYDAKTKIFRFDGDVNMFTDSVFIKTADLTFYSQEDYADFNYGVDFWKNSNMLSALSGRYDRAHEFFYFYDDVHGMTDKQEGWADTLHFNKATQDLDLYGNVQVTDDSRKVSGLGEHFSYVDSLDRITMSVDATIIAEIEDESNKNKPKDTLYMAADRIVRTAIPRCDLNEGLIKDSEKRLSDLEIDPVSAYRKKAGEAAQKAAADREREIAESQGKKFPDKKEAAPAAPGKQEPAPAKPKSTETGPTGTESTEAAPPESSEPESPEAESAEPASAESEGQETHPDGEEEPAPEGVDPAAAPSDSTMKAPADSTMGPLEPKDTTKISFVEAIGNVRVFKADMQARCDSLLYTDLDSLARLYLDPVVWNEGNRQYVSDSITVVVENSRMRKASLMSNAFITIQEDSVSYDQIRGAEMMAYFDTTTVLERFDALGGASAVFYLEENDALATVNKVESKMLSAYFEKGELQRIYYFDNPHNDAYPTVQLPHDDRQMKGFRWDPDRRPTGMADITPYTPRRSQRLEYESRPQAKFPQTEIYFPGYMKEVYAGLAARDSAQRASRRMRDSLELDKPVPPVADTASVLPPNESEEPDNTESAKPGETESGEAPAEISETTEPDGKEGTEDTGTAPATAPEAADSLNKAAQKLSPADSLAAAKDRADSLARAEAEAKRAARDSTRQARIAKKEARWAALDERDAAKEAKKEAKKLARYRKLVAKKLEIRDKETEREQKRLDKYIKKYQKIKDKRDARRLARPVREKPVKVKPVKGKSAKDESSKDESAPENPLKILQKEPSGSE